MGRLATIAGTGLALAALPTGFAGCGTISHGSLQRIAVTSEPAGAQVTIDGKQYLDTPFTAALARKREHTVAVAKPGYEPQTISLRRRVDREVVVDNMYLILVAYSGLIGLPLDAATGALYELYPQRLRVRLVEPPQETEAETPPARAQTAAPDSTR